MLILNTVIHCYLFVLVSLLLSTSCHKSNNMPQKKQNRQIVAIAVACAETDAAVLAIPEVVDYRLQFNPFKAFVDGNVELSSMPSYITWLNVHCREVGPSAMGKILPALRWYSQHVGAAETFR
jgi:hypothetical protein